jgi:hypothetical protein
VHTLLQLPLHKQRAALQQHHGDGAGLDTSQTLWPYSPSLAGIMLARVMAGLGWLGGPLPMVPELTPSRAPRVPAPSAAAPASRPPGPCAYCPSRANHPSPTLAPHRSPPVRLGASKDR